jgi:hypothetical protein
MTPEEEMKAKQVLAERAHQQAMQNAQSAAKAQLGVIANEPKPKTSAAPAEPKPTNTKANASEGTGSSPDGGLPITAAKRQRLTTLLDAYMKDQITPAQYHLERAKILAEP